MEKIKWKIKRFMKKHNTEIYNTLTGVIFFFLTYGIFVNPETDFSYKFTGWIFLFLISAFVIYLVNCKPSKKGFPMLNERLTEQDEDGRIRIKRENLEKAISYLYEVEEFLDM